MPYIVVKCAVKELDTGSTYFGDKTTEAEIVQSLGRTWYSSTSGYYVVHEPVCWVLNRLEERGYLASQPMLHNDHLLWVLHKSRQSYFQN